MHIFKTGASLLIAAVTVLAYQYPVQYQSGQSLRAPGPDGLSQPYHIPNQRAEHAYSRHGVPSLPHYRRHADALPLYAQNAIKRRNAISFLASRQALKERSSFSPSQFARRAGNPDIYVAFGNRRKPSEALHWMIVVSPENTNEATYYHVAGGPTQGKPFKAEIQAGKRLDSNGIAEKHKVGTVPATEINKIKSAAQRAALPGTGENCQNYAVKVLTELEGKGFVAAGTATTYTAKIEKVDNRAKTPPVEPIASTSTDPKSGK